MRIIRVYCPEEHRYSIITDWLAENECEVVLAEVDLDGKDSNRRIYLDILFSSDTDAVHFKLRFADDLLIKPRDQDAAFYYCPYVPLMSYGPTVDFTPKVSFKTRYNLNSGTPFL